jgi:hypothetical protein
VVQFVCPKVNMLTYTRFSQLAIISANPAIGPGGYLPRVGPLPVGAGPCQKRSLQQNHFDIQGGKEHFPTGLQPFKVDNDHDDIPRANVGPVSHGILRQAPVSPLPETGEAVGPHEIADETVAGYSFLADKTGDLDRGPSIQMVVHNEICLSHVSARTEHLGRVVCRKS